MYSKLVLILILVGLQSGINVSAHDDAVPQLEIRRLSVTPSIVTVGGVVTVEAVLVNSGNAPVHNLLLGAAVAGKSSGDWISLEKIPSEPIEILLPSQEVQFRATVQLNTPGVFRVGVAGLAANVLLEPKGWTVQVIDPASMLFNGVILFALYALIIGVGALLLRAMLVCSILRSAPTTSTESDKVDDHLAERSKKSQLWVRSPLWFRPVKWGFVAALAFMVLVPSSLVSLVPIGRAVISPENLWAIPVSVGLYIIGWLLAGAALRPCGSAWRGIGAAGILYLLIGFLWVVSLNIVGGTPPLALLGAPANVVTGALFWPFGVAQALGLFGLEIG